MDYVEYSNHIESLDKVKANIDKISAFLDVSVQTNDRLTLDIARDSVRSLELEIVLILTEFSLRTSL